MTAIWELLGGGKLPGVSDDHVRWFGHTERFINICRLIPLPAGRPGSAVPLHNYTDRALQTTLFGQTDDICTRRRCGCSKHWASGLVQRLLHSGNISVDMMTPFRSDHDIEQFEDDPLEFIRLDLSVPSTSAGTIGGTSSEAVTRRQAAADVLKALVVGGLEEETTEVVGSLIQKGLEAYSSNPRDNWRSKDVAVYLLGAIATRGSTVAVRLFLIPLAIVRSPLSLTFSKGSRPRTRGSTLSISFRTTFSKTSRLLRGLYTRSCRSTLSGF